MRELAGEAVHQVLDVGGVPLRHEVEDALQAETLIGAGLDGVPDLVVEHMKLRKEGTVGYVAEALRGDSRGGVLDEILHHLHALHVGAFLVHDVHHVLAVLQQVFLRHLADGVGLVDDVVFAELVVAAVDGEVRTHNDSAHQALLLVLHLVELQGLGFAEVLEVL